MSAYITSMLDEIFSALAREYLAHPERVDGLAERLESDTLVDVDGCDIPLVVLPPE